MISPLHRFNQVASLARDWIAPGQAIVQWTHFVTSACNARCRHCFYPINQRQNELTLEEIERFLGTVPPIRLLLFSGGEPFLRKDLPEIVNLYYKHSNCFTASIPTNGYSSDRICSAVERIIRVAPGLQLGITVSLDGMKDFHDDVRQVPGLWDRAVDTVRAAKRLSRDLPGLTVGVNTVFMRDNQTDLQPLLEFVHSELRPTFHALSFIRGRPLGDARLASELDVDRYLELSRWLDSRYSSNDEWSGGWRGVRARVRHALSRQRYEYIARQARGGAFERPCLAGEREYVLSETGDLFGCELISDRLGNVREANFDFSNIQRGAARSTFIHERIERNCRCTHECNVRTMLFFDRRNAFPLISAAIRIDNGPRDP